MATPGFRELRVRFGSGINQCYCCARTGGGVSKPSFFLRKPKPRTLSRGEPLLSPLYIIDWVAVKVLKLTYYIGETLFFYIYHYGNLI